MNTIEQRLQAYAAELEVAADLADARRRSAGIGGERLVTPSRRAMSPWQRMAIAAAALAILGAGLWSITGRHSSDAPVGTAPITTPISDPSVAVAGSAAPWYRITAAGLTAMPIEKETCCAANDVPGPPTVVSWQGSGGPSHELLVLTVYPADEAGGASSPHADSTVTPQADGSVWQFWSYGMSTARREALAAQVVPGSGLPFVLPDPSMSLLSIGGLGPAAHSKAQTYLSPGSGDPGVAFATIGVGSDRGLFRALARALSITDTTVAGMPAYRSEQSDGTVTYDWRSTAGQWASLIVGRALAADADVIAASVVPDQSELLPPGMEGTSKGSSRQSAEFADRVDAALATLGWSVTLDETATRTTPTGVDVQWAYFRDGDRRLFVVSGPPDLLDGQPELKRHLTVTSEVGAATTTYAWPRETWLYTAALSNATRTVIIRSEGTDSTHAARSAADMDELLQTASRWP